MEDKYYLLARAMESISGLLKVYLTDRSGNREGVWLQPTGHNAGEILNLPVVVRRYKYMDIVEYDPDSKVVRRLVQDGGYTRTKFVGYEGESRIAIQDWLNRGYMVEHLTPESLGLTRKRRPQQRRSGTQS